MCWQFQNQLFEILKCPKVKYEPNQTKRCVRYWDIRQGIRSNNGRLNKLNGRSCGWRFR